MNEIRNREMNKVSSRKNLYLLNTPEMIERLGKDLGRVIISLGSTSDEIKLKKELLSNSMVISKLSSYEFGECVKSLGESSLGFKAKLELLEVPRIKNDGYYSTLIISSLGEGKEALELKYRLLTDEEMLKKYVDYLEIIVGTIGEGKEAFEMKKRLLNSSAIRDNSYYLEMIISSLGDGDEAFELMKELLSNDSILRRLDKYGLYDILGNLGEGKERLGFKIKLLNNKIVRDNLGKNLVTIVGALKNSPEEMLFKLQLLNNRDMWFNMKECLEDVINSLGESKEILKKNLQLLEDSFDEKTINEVRELIDIIKRVKCSNSLEMSNLSTELIVEILSNDNRIDTLDKIEGVFLKNDIPMVGKIFLCFQLLYPDLNKTDRNLGELFDFSSYSMVAPELKDRTIIDRILKKYSNKVRKGKEEYFEDNPEVARKLFNEVRFQIIFNDLLRIAVGSNNRSLRNYLDNIEKGNSLYLSLISGEKKFDCLKDEEIGVLDIFVTQLEQLYNNTKKGNNNSVDLVGKTILEKIEVLFKLFKPTSRYDLPDRIVRNFCYYAGYKSFKELRDNMILGIEEANLKGRKMASIPFELVEGDFIRGIGDLKVLARTLNDGNVCGEYLGTIKGVSRSDVTPLDTDWTRINKKDLKDTIEASLVGTPTSIYFGNIYFVMKNDNPNINITRDREEKVVFKKYDSSKIEMFRSGSKSHWGARTGTSSSDIDYIVWNGKWANKNINEIAAIKMEIAKNGIYIPVVDMSGKLIFDPVEYDELREKTSGLSYYDNSNYKLSSNDLGLPMVSIVTIDKEENLKTVTIPSVDETVKLLKVDDIRREELICKIRDKFSLFIKENTETLELVDFVTGNITKGKAELLGSGSTALGTSIPGNLEFNYILRLDGDECSYDKMQRLFASMQKYFEPKSIVFGDDNDFNGKNIEIYLNNELVNVDLGVTVVQRTMGVDYSSEMALEERLSSIREQYPYQYEAVRANIVNAKILLKETGVLVSSKSNGEQVGLDERGVENWILQNGGSLEQAIDSFLVSATNKENGQIRRFEEFKEIYQIWDLGGNYNNSVSEYSYVDFISLNMNEKCYKRMYQVLRKYKESLAFSRSKIDDGGKRANMGGKLR
jgi:hypothetical protein